MRFAYADPPYLTCGARYYGRPEWDDPARHLALVDELTAGYPDGWALSSRAVDLRWLLPACPDDVLVGAWTKPFAGSARQHVRIYRVWEPVIYRTARRNTDTGPRVRDALVVNPTRQLGFIGAKPAAFNRWIADLLGYVDGDDLDDLYPGTGGMGRELDQYTFTIGGD
jgi:hypothetical protein